jgi:hypothetical protein
MRIASPNLAPQGEQGFDPPRFGLGVRAQKAAAKRVPDSAPFHPDVHFSDSISRVTG